MGSCTATPPPSTGQKRALEPQAPANCSHTLWGREGDREGKGGKGGERERGGRELGGRERGGRVRGGGRGWEGEGVRMRKGDSKEVGERLGNSADKGLNPVRFGVQMGDPLPNPDTIIPPPPPPHPTPHITIEELL